MSTDDQIDPADAAAQALASRYGRTPGNARRRVIVIASIAGTLLVSFVLWLWWAGIVGSPTSLEVRDIGHVIVSDSETEVRWQLTVTPGSATRCAVHALNESFGIVGWIVIDVPPSTELTRDFTQVVRTSELAVSGLIYRCWLT